MKVRLSVKELRNYFERRNQFTVIFNSENQEWYWVADPLKIRMVFSKVKVLENPNIQNIYISRQRTRNNVALERKPP